VGRDEAVIREYIRRQEDEDKRLDQMNLWRWLASDMVAQELGAVLATPDSCFERLTTLSPWLCRGMLTNLSMKISDPCLSGLHHPYLCTILDFQGYPLCFQ
jgi:hypothetical protein